MGRKVGGGTGENGGETSPAGLEKKNKPKTHALSLLGKSSTTISI